MKRGDIYLVSLDPAIGREQQGSRPVLIVSPEAFNRRMNLAAIAPITSGGAFARNAGFAVSLLTAGIKTTGVILCHQLRMIDIQARKGRYLETTPVEIVEDVLARLEMLFQ